MSFVKIHRNVRGSDPLMGKAAPVLAIGQAEFEAVVSNALQAAFGHLRNPVKALAKVANKNERTAENWYTGKCAPNGLALLQLMAQVPELQAEVRRLTAMESDLDPRLERQLHETFLLFQQTRQRPREQFCLAPLRVA